MQKKCFLKSEGDSWFKRNHKKLDEKENCSNDEILKAISYLRLNPQKILEIGCSNGWRLNLLSETLNSECFGLDPSKNAVSNGLKKYKNIELNIGTADCIPYKNEMFDLIIYGFCLYLCDRNDLFKIASEADRILINYGYIAILDFYPPFPYKNIYEHKENVYSYKMDYSQLFLWNPSYSVLYKKVFSHNVEKQNNINPDDKISVIIIQKNNDNYIYPEKPFNKN